MSEPTLDDDADFVPALAAVIADQYTEIQRLRDKVIVDQYDEIARLRDAVIYLVNHGGKYLKKHQPVIDAALETQNPDKNWSMDYGGGPAPAPETDAADAAFPTEGAFATLFPPPHKLERERDEACVSEAAPAPETDNFCKTLGKHPDNALSPCDWSWLATPNEAAFIEFARQLERERDDARAEIERMQLCEPYATRMLLLRRAEKAEADAQTKYKHYQFELNRANEAEAALAERDAEIARMKEELSKHGKH